MLRIVRSLTGIDFAYIVDNYEAHWGTRIQGLDVKSPDALLEEDQAVTAVVICSSARLAIKEQIMSMGGFKILIALNDVVYGDIRAFIEQCFREARPKPKAVSDTAIVIQGPVYRNLTPRIVRHFATHYPEHRIVLSTWKDVPADALAEIAPFIDDLVQSDLPSVCGLGNRNYQLVSSLAGVRLAAERGAAKVLKTRTDMYLLAKGVFTQMESLLALYDRGACRKFGMKDRLVILDQCSNKFLPYSTSDIITYGHAEDVLGFWDCPLDTRDVIWDSYQPLREISRGMFFPETWFSRHFARKIGWELKDTFEDSFSFFRDLFLVVDTDWLGFFLEKYPYPERYTCLEDLRSRVTHYFWQGLLFGNKAMWDEAKLFDVAKNNWYDTFVKERETLVE